MMISFENIIEGKKVWEGNDLAANCYEKVPEGVKVTTVYRYGKDAVKVYSPQEFNEWRNEILKLSNSYFQ